MPSVQASWEFTPPAQNPVDLTETATTRALEELFELDIVPEAKALSPVSTAWPSIPEARGEKRTDTGHNRRTIDAAVEETPDGPQASLFTQSGYGGYLEVGTSKMPARPYLWPAFEKHIDSLGARVREKLRQLYG